MRKNSREDIIVTLIKQGLCNLEIIKIVGCTSSAVSVYRKKNNLLKKIFKKINHDTVISLLKKGLTNTEISHMLNCSNGFICVCRKRYKKQYNLPDSLKGGAAVSLANRKLNGERSRKRGCSIETRNKLRIIAQSQNRGINWKSIPYTTKSGDIVKLQSSWEIKTAQSLDKNNINWIRPNRFPYHDINNILRHYYPDFYLTDYNVYLDPKNEYAFKVDVFKIKQVISENNINVIILDRNHLEWEQIKELLPKGLKH